MWKFPQTAGDIKGQPLANYAAQDFDSLKRLIQTRIAKPFHDVWICMGTQRLVDPKTTRDGFPKAIRQLPNLVSLKSVWLDIDVKKDAYATTAEAAMALNTFVVSAGLPRPTMIVKSGSGGLHVYWCVSENMPVEAWRPLAHGLRDAALANGLKFDPQVTSNAAGVLRVPTSLNWKTGTPAPVQLLVTADERFPVYTYAQLTNVLSAYVGSLAGVKVGTGTGRSSNFTAGVNASAPPIALDDVAAVCPLTDDTLKRGGSGDPEPLWNLLMMLASFTDDPITDAHRLSNGDARYSQAETDRKIQEKINARANNPAIGWPSCSSFAPLNPHCRTCPFNGQGKSPLNFAARTQHAPPGATPQQGDTLVPAPYWRDVRGHVYRTYTDPNGSQATIDLLNQDIIDANIDEVNNQLVFKTTLMGKQAWVTVPSGATAQVATVIGHLGKAPSGGIAVPAKLHQKVRDFVVAWITHLQAQRKTITVSGYGWSDDMKTFTFGEKMFTPTGVERSYMNKTFDPRFRESGDLKPWQDAMALVYGKHALEIVVASSFAAPLTALLGSTSSVLSIYSAASGVGKSTAMRLAQAVWGHPISGMSSLDDTVNSVKKKISDLKSLPAYWDELLTADATEKVVDLVFSFTQGKAKSRLTQNSEQMEANAFITMFAIASNHGVGSRLYSDTSGTEAGGLRIFEVEANAHPMTHSLQDANQLLGKLAQNFGAAGTIFAEKLIADRANVEKVLQVVASQLDADHTFNQKERYWRSTMVVVLAGACLANRYGLATFDIKGIQARLGDELNRQRARLVSKAHVTMSHHNSVLDLLNELQGELHGKHLVTTDIVPIGAGRPRNIQVIDTDVSRLQGAWMQVGEQDGRIRIVSKKFDKWCLDNRQNPDNVLKLLRNHYDVQTGQFTIGAGVPMLNSGTKGLAGRNTCYDLTPLVSAAASPPAGGHSATGSSQQGQP
jgi:hypothetical protein